MPSLLLQLLSGCLLNVTQPTCGHAHLNMRCAGADSCQPLALAKMAVYSQLQGTLCHLTILSLNLVMLLVHVHCKVLEVTSQRTC